MIKLGKKPIHLWDEVSGITGIFDRKEPAPGKEFRYIIYYREPKFLSFFGRTMKKLPGTVPADGIVTLSEIECVDGFSKVVIKSYGDDTVHPNLVQGKWEVKVGEIISKNEDLAREGERITQSVRSEQRMIDRNRGEEVKKMAEIVKDLTAGQKKPGQQPIGGLNDLSDFGG